MVASGEFEGLTGFTTNLFCTATKTNFYKYLYHENDREFKIEFCIFHFLGKFRKRFHIFGRAKLPLSICGEYD